MPAYQFTDFGYSLVIGGAGGAATPLNAGDTTLLITTGDGNTWFPSVFPFQILLGPNQKGAEIAQCTARSGDTLTLVRGQEGTAAQQWQPGTSVKVVVSQAVMAETMRNSYQYLYLPAGWDTAWQAAKKASASSPASVVAIGDSITAGQYSTDIMSTAWWPQVRSAILGQGYTLGGDYYSWLYAATTGLSTASPPLTITGSNPTDFSPYYCGFQFGCFSSAVSHSPYATCTPPYNVTGFDILYIDYQTGSPGWTYNIDGGSNTNVNTTGPNSAAGAIVKKVSITGLSNASHTLNINSVGIANGCAILGVAAYSSTTVGIRFANMGWPGMGLVTGQNTHNALADTGQFPPDRLALYQGYQGTTAAPNQLRGLGFPAQPDLAFIAFGVNDVNNGVTATNFEDNLRRLVQVLRYGGGHAGSADACSVMIIGMYTADNLVQSSTAVPSTDYTGAASPGIQEFYDAMKQVAQEYGCAYASVHTLFGRTPATNGWTTGVTNIHPTNSGYTKIANLLTQVL